MLKIKVSKRKIFISSVLCVTVFLGFVAFCSDIGEFTRAIFRNPTGVGAAFPSSYFLAKKITKNIVAKDTPLKILEVGAGTGVFTKEIIKKMGPNDILDVIEVDSGFCDVLNKKYRGKKNARIHCVSILDWAPNYKYDYIVSGLPFNAFGSKFVQDVLDKYKNVIVDNGILSYFEYALAGKVKKLITSGDKKTDLLKNIELRREFLEYFEFDRDFIALNIPPAYVYHLRIVKS